MLLINPHQSFVGVQRYAEIHLDSREGLRFSGLTVFGFLLPYMGNSDRLGWAYTDNYADHSDLYAETFEDAASSLRYRYGADWRTAGDARGHDPRAHATTARSTRASSASGARTTARSSACTTTAGRSRRGSRATRRAAGTTSGTR